MNKLLYAFMIASHVAAGLSACGPVGRSAPVKSVPPVPTPLETGPIVGIGVQTASPIDSMLLVYVPAGSFSMGSEIGLTDEQPVHTVALDAFWIDQTEVTNGMYAACVGAGDCGSPSEHTDFADAAYADHPVVFVSWNDARNYCAWAGRRLPTEAEWEKAAAWAPLLSEKRVYPWGDEFDCKRGNFDDETQDDDFVVAGGPDCDGYPRSSPVGSYLGGASPYGALDMAGNVWEWVHDAFVEVDPFDASIPNYYEISPAANPTGVDPSITEYRVMRGGSWNVNFGFGRSAYRLWFGLDDSYDFAGFRCAESE